MELTDKSVADFNLLAAWLAMAAERPAEIKSAGLIILAGHAVIPAIEGTLRLAQQKSLPLLLSGGIGHSTPLLWQALNADERYRGITEGGEAEMLGQLVQRHFTLTEGHILLEKQSRNCGENARFSLEYLRRQAGEIPQKIVLAQDPLMQRRTNETFKYVWQQNHLQAEFIPWPVFTPELHQTAQGLKISGAASDRGLWSVERYISMILGEMKRLNDDKQGYGPAGSGFIGHVAIPPAVEAAWQRILAQPQFSAQVR